MIRQRSKSDRRERKRLETRGKVVRSATELFEQRGYESTTMEDVAAHADVGIGTLYNYFGSKERLLLAAFEEASEPLFLAAARLVESPDSDPEAALVRLIEVFEPLATMFKKSVLREMFAAALVQPSDRVEEFASIDVKFAASLGELLAKLAATGAVAAEVDIEAGAIALYGALAVPMLLYLSVEDMDRATLEQLVRRQVHIVFKGLEPRPAPTRSSPRKSPPAKRSHRR
jgi:AcrR family transcriptional regulator